MRTAETLLILVERVKAPLSSMKMCISRPAETLPLIRCSEKSFPGTSDIGD
jgi:hypothetical protein